MSYDPERLETFFRSLTPEQIQEGNRKNDEEHERQALAFRAAYVNDRCYLCGNAFDQIRSKDPCIHWLLRRAKFRKKDFPAIYGRFGYYNIAAFLRWCANQDAFLRNINDLEEEKADRKIISYTVKWKNIDWTFDCTENDLAGHGRDRSARPHYHFQMRIDGRQFINFNDFHVPFHDSDLFELGLRNKQWYRQGFGTIGSGMQEAVSASPEDVIEHTIPSVDENEAQYHLSTIVEARDSPIPGALLHEIFEEARRTGKSIAYIAQNRLRDLTDARIIVSLAESIPDIAARTENKPR